MKDINAIKRKQENFKNCILRTYQYVVEYIPYYYFGMMNTLEHIVMLNNESLSKNTKAEQTSVGTGLTVIQRLVNYLTVYQELTGTEKTGEVQKCINLLDKYKPRTYDEVSQRISLKDVYAECNERYPQSSLELRHKSQVLVKKLTEEYFDNLQGLTTMLQMLDLSVASLELLGDKRLLIEWIKEPYNLQQEINLGIVGIQNASEAAASIDRKI